jgi:RHS repeat-associated protein
VNSGSDVSARKYIGQFYDASDNLSYLNARYYDATRGQFVTEDPMFWGKQHLDDPQKLNPYTYARNNPITLLDTSGWDSAYFAAKSVGNANSWSNARTVQDFAGLMGAEHNYVSFSIDSAAGLSQLSIPGVSAQNGVANFTLSFEPSNPSSPQGSDLVQQVNADLADAQAYGGSKGRQNIESKNYAQLANNMYLAGEIISGGKKRYNAWPELLPGGGYNSNSGLYTTAKVNGQGPAFTQFQQTLSSAGGRPYGNGMAISMSMGGGTFIGTYNFGAGVGTYDFGKQSWVTAPPSPPKTGSR